MKRLSLLAILAFTCCTGYAQIPDIEAAKNRAFQAAKAMDEALVNKHYDDYVAYNHPKVLEQVEGGRSGMVMQTMEQIKNIEESGNFITAVWPKMPTVMVDTAGEWQCSLPQFMEYRLPDGKIRAETTLIGISPDKGNTWYFLDAAGRTLKDLQQLFPNLSNRLTVAPPAEPIFTPDAKK